jgi:hypothetical protein
VSAKKKTASMLASASATTRMVSSIEFPVPGPWLCLIPATDLQEWSFGQGRQGDSMLHNGDLNCDE